MPKKSWPFAIQIMKELAARTMGHAFIPDDVARDITAYYYGSSPESLPLLPYHRDAARPLQFLHTELGDKSPTPLVINVKLADLGGSTGTQLLVCDGGRNEVSLLTRTGATWAETTLAKVQVPSRTEVVDYDLDGDQDIIVAALGYFPPSDRLAGKVLILRQSDSGEFHKEVLLEGVGRIADTRAVDIDNDGDLDLAVAIFGGREIGELAWLENRGEGGHVKHALLSGGGALNMSPVDLNADGKVDFVSLIAQEHELIVALMNRRQGRFEQVPLARAPHPMFGSTGMSLVDLDADGDVDILFTNGDAHDLQKDPKPYHGVQWLENRGKLDFRYHDIGRFYGAATAIAGDLDADGDLDVVASSWNNYWADARRQSLIWFENDGEQSFTRHNITNTPAGIVSLALQDVTGNDRLDIIAGVFRVDALMSAVRPGDKGSVTDAGKQPSQARVVLLENGAAAKNRPTSQAAD